MSLVCEHGQLSRSCEVCAKDAEIERLRAELTRKQFVDDLSLALEQGNAVLRAALTKQEKKLRNQRTELRRLNKYLGPYWAGFRKGIDMEAAVRLRGIMNAAFGHEAVRAAEVKALEPKV